MPKGPKENIPDTTPQKNLFQSPFEGRPDLLRFEKTIRLAVSGDVQLTKLERLIIDTPDFQRLRGLRQLGLAMFVYPTALHTRFDHSLGVLHMAAEMLGHLKKNLERDSAELKGAQVQITLEHEVLTRLYALLHDITHIPFGHTTEDELQIFTRHDENSERIERFLGTDSKIGRIIIENTSKDTHQSLLDIYKWDGERDLRGNEFIHDIVSNTVCADLLDYLARDNYFCNLGISMEYRFLKFLHLQFLHGKPRVFVRVWKRKNDGKEARRDTLTDLVRLLESRYLLAERVYFHHTKICASAMLGRAIQEAQMAEPKIFKEDNFYRHTDDTLIDLLCKSGVELTRRLANDIHYRILYKVIDVYTEESFIDQQRRDQTTNPREVAKKLVGNPTTRRQLEDELAMLIGAERGQVLAYAVQDGGNKKLAETNVEWEGSQTYLKEITDRIVKAKLDATLAAHEKLWAIYIVADDRLGIDKKISLRKLSKIMLTGSSTEKEDGLKRYYEDAVEKHAVLSNMNNRFSAEEHIKRRAAAGEELQRISLDKEAETRTFEEKLNAVVRKHFSS